MTATRGRPRSAAVDDALRAAALDLLATRGYPGVGIDAVAARAGVAKTAVYRRWPSKAEMVFALVVHDATIVPPPDSGSLVTDVRALTARVVEILAAPAARRAVPGLLADLAVDPRLAARFRQVFLAPQQDVVAAVLARARQRGERLADVEVQDVHAHLLGAVLVWTSVGPARLPPDLVERIAGDVVRSLRPAAAVEASS